MDVIATIWKVPYYADRNQRMIEAGASIFRVKCSHDPVADISAMLVQARAQITASGRPVKLLTDLPEGKIRLGTFPNFLIPVEAGMSLLFQTGTTTPDPQQFVPIDYPELAGYLTTGDEFITGDGDLLFRITEIVNKDSFRAVAANKGQLKQRKALTIPKLADSLNHLPEEIDTMLAELPKSRPEMVAFSFVSSKKMLLQLIEKLSRYTNENWRPMILAKIETQAGVDNIEEILEVADGIMVARGDLALTVPFERLGLIQKKLVAKARQAGKYVIVSTGMLQSLLENYIPMRSDILDLTNACLDGASAVMFCPETARSETPERTITVAKQIIAEVEKSRR